MAGIPEANLRVHLLQPQARPVDTFVSPRAVTSPAWKMLPPELQVAAARDAIGQFRLQAKAQMLAEYPEITQDRIKAQAKVFEALGAFPQE